MLSCSRRPVTFCQCFMRLDLQKMGNSCFDGVQKSKEQDPWLRSFPSFLRSVFSLFLGCEKALVESLDVELPRLAGLDLRTQRRIKIALTSRSWLVFNHVGFSIILVVVLGVCNLDCCNNATAQGR